MTDDEKNLLSTHGFKDYQQNKEGNVIAWKKDLKSHDSELVIWQNESEVYDVSIKENKHEETQNQGKWKTLHNNIEDVESAVDFSNHWLMDNGYDADLDAVKPVFNADPRKIAEDIVELERSLDEEQYDATFPDSAAHIEELTQDIANGNIEFLIEYLQSFNLQELDAEKKMAETLLLRLQQYESAKRAYNQVLAAAEMDAEDNYNSIDGIIGNSAPKEHKRVHIKTMIEENRRRLGLSGDPEPNTQDEHRTRK